MLVRGKVYTLRSVEAAPQTTAKALQIDASLFSRDVSASTTWIESSWGVID
jgi:hypothetical protein